MLLLLPLSASAFELAHQASILYGYDDNTNQKQECQKRSSHFFSVAPALFLSSQAEESTPSSGGYELTYTSYLDGDKEDRLHHLLWYEVSQRLQPGLFQNIQGEIAALDNRENPENDGWGYTLTSDLTYHFSPKISARIEAGYAWWRYDSTTFDTGRTIITLQERQHDDRYEGEIALISLLSLDTRFDLAYRLAYNDSNNVIDVYHTNALIARLHTAIMDNTKLTIEYAVSQWDYDNWRAGKKLQGKLRNDDQTVIRLTLDYALSKAADLFIDYEVTHHDSNLKYESFDRHLIYSGIRVHW